jgi:uncharacterized membrane protein YphA (DoxX/SURF4 family)
MSRRRRPPTRGGGVLGWLWEPQPIVRIEALRVLLPLCILGFMSTRLIHAAAWIGDAGFQVPDTGGDWRQPLYIPPLPAAAAWGVAGAMVVSGLSLAAGLLTRASAGVFALTLFFVALADRLSAFTVTKLGAVLALALFLSPCGTRFGVDAWRARRRQPERPRPTLASGPNVRFFQLLVVVLYVSSGVCKARGDWLATPFVLWTHLHDSYQTAVSHLLANALPPLAWTLLQGTTLAFEALAPLWFALAATRPYALAYGLAMHLMIGVMFGPVIWFSLLMCTLLAAGFLPDRWLERALAGRAPEPRDGSG